MMDLFSMRTRCCYSYFSNKSYAVCTHKKCFSEVLLMDTHSISVSGETYLSGDTTYQNRVKISADDVLKYFFLYFSENRLTFRANRLFRSQFA